MQQLSSKGNAFHEKRVVNVIGRYDHANYNRILVTIDFMMTMMTFSQTMMAHTFKWYVALAICDWQRLKIILWYFQIRNLFLQPVAAIERHWLVCQWQSCINKMYSYMPHPHRPMETLYLSIIFYCFWSDMSDKKICYITPSPNTRNSYFMLIDQR